MVDENKPLEGEEPSAPSEGEAPAGEQPKGRTAEDRINELLSKNKEVLEELRSTKEEVGNLKTRLEKPVPAPVETPSEETTPDVQKAIDFLKSKGKFVTQEDLAKRDQAVQDRMYLDSQHQRLENKFDGSDGKPKYDRAKAEEYMRTHPVYDPEVAYNELYRPELLDFEIKKLEADRKKKPYVARTSPSAGQQAEDMTITIEKIAEVNKNPTPENRAWYEKNRGKILKLMAEQKL